MEHFYNEVNWVYHNGKGFLGGHAPSERRKWAGAFTMELIGSH